MKKQKLDNLSDKDIVLYALYILGGWYKRVHTEDIAIECYKIAPSKFSWVKYPQYPDLAPTRFALEAAKKPESGCLVMGESERKRTVKKVGGWMLTAEGIKWIKLNKARIEKYLGKQRPAGDRVSIERKLNYLLKSKAFKKFIEFGQAADISHAEFADSLICTVNTRPEVLNARLEQLYSIGEELKKEEVKNYVSFCIKKFAALLGKKGGENNAKR